MLCPEPFKPCLRVIPTPAPSNDEALRGILLHRFVQERARDPFDANAAWTWLRCEAKKMHLPEHIIASLPVSALLRVPSCPEFVFLQKGKAEVTIFEGEKTLRLDSLYVDEARAVVIEIKTGGNLSSAWDDLPREYRQQTATYRRIIQALFPDRHVTAFLLETETAQFISPPVNVELDERMRLGS